MIPKEIFSKFPSLPFFPQQSLNFLTGNSHFGDVEANDGYDTIEYIASLQWCNGNVGLAGNSWLGIAQWFIAATQPPHLKCIAPLEGAGDLYRDILCRGGIPQTAFWNFLSGLLRGELPPLLPPRLDETVVYSPCREKPAGGCGRDVEKVSAHEQILGKQTSKHEPYHCSGICCRKLFHISSHIRFLPGFPRNIP